MATNAVLNNGESADKPINKTQTKVTTWKIRLAKNSKKRMHVMQFNETQQVMFADWKRANMRRENNFSLYTHRDEEPKFGGGTEFKARRAKRRRGYKPENQPWILTTNTIDRDKQKRDNDKTFRGTREGGVSENCAYYIFVKDKDDDGMVAYPVQDWYKFHPTQRYKTLTFEEAEEEFTRRHLRLNYFSLMTQRRLRCKKENENANNQATALRKTIKDFKISEIDDWVSSSEDGGSDEDNKSIDNDKNRKKKKARSKKKRASDDEAFEESDDGDEEGRECEYITDSSASESELEQQREEGPKSVAEEPGLKILFSSDSESQIEEKEDERSDKDKDTVSKGKTRSDKEKTARGADKSVNLQGEDKENMSAGGNLLDAAAKNQKRTKSVSSDEVQPKRYKCDSAAALSDVLYISGASESGISIGAVTRYLKRKPMTLVDLIKKFKSKKNRLSKEEMGDILTRTLQKMNLKTQKISDVTYYSL